MRRLRRTTAPTITAATTPRNSAISDEHAGCRAEVDPEPRRDRRAWCSARRTRCTAAASTIPATTAGMTPVPVRSTRGCGGGAPATIGSAGASAGSTRSTVRSRAASDPRVPRAHGIPVAGRVNPGRARRGSRRSSPSRMRYARSIGCVVAQADDHVHPRRGRRPGARRSATGTRRCGCGSASTPTISSPRASAARIAREHVARVDGVGHAPTRRRCGTAAPR